jgi:hypothetical protein
MTESFLKDGPFIGHFMIFMAMGAGANWVLPTALAQEIPYLENTQPERLCIATYMNVANAVGLLSMLLYVYALRMNIVIPYSYSVPSLLWASSLGCFFSAAVYKIVIDNASIMLYLCCFIGGSIGCLSSVIMNPFMTSFENNFISAARSGGSFYIMLCAFIALAQNPGSSHLRFSPSVYFVIFGAILILPVFAYRYIVSNNVGGRKINISDAVANNSVTNPAWEDISEDDIFPSKKPNTAVFQIASVAEKREVMPTSSAFFGESSANALLRCFADFVVPTNLRTKYPWLRDAIPYMMTVGWINFNTWGLVTSLTPFAMSAASNGSGSIQLATAYQLGAIALVCGDVSTTFFKIPIYIGVLIFSACCINIYVASGGGRGYDTPAAAPILICIFTLQRFVESHMITSTYRSVATVFSAETREAASRAVGMIDMLSTTAGAIISLIIVTTVYSC